ncbi:hypothetical protein GCM10023307_20240 [Lysobacter hankyongensis]|uniref:R body protein RebB-like protein n=1 Tax=Lysobacter hankyongensis TaxID=1176535 RepID=A0ABP9BFH8_9GAMM
MAFPTAVNDQITDSITQSNIKVVGESPAFAMSSIYQSLAHSTGILFENAVAAQQQQNTLAQAAANQGVMQIYSLDTTAAAGATDKIGQTGLTDNLTSLLTVLNAFRNQPMSLKAAPMADASQAAEADAASADTAGREIADQIRAAVTFSNETVLGHSQAFLSGLHGGVDAMAHALDTMNRVTHDNMVHILQEAALAATLAAMLREPEKSTEYEAVLQAIKRMA